MIRVMWFWNGMPRGAWVDSEDSLDRLLTPLLCNPFVTDLLVIDIGNLGGSNHGWA